MVMTESDGLERVAHDFGHVVRSEPVGVVQPRSEQEVAALVRDAGSAGERLTVRGAGHSFGGQSLPARSVVVDMSPDDVVFEQDAVAFVRGGGEAAAVRKSPLSARPPDNRQLQITPAMPMDGPPVGGSDRHIERLPSITARAIAAKSCYWVVLPGLCSRARAGLFHHAESQMGRVP